MSNRITCAIIDDEPLAVELLECYVNKFPFLEWTGSYSSAVEAIEPLKNNPVDIIFLDIQMPDLTGMDFAHMIGEETMIVFTTAFNQYAVEGYKVNAIDYLLKPISYTDFLNAAYKALNIYEKTHPGELETKPAPKEEEYREQEGVVFVKSNGKFVQVLLDKIIYIEGLKDYVKIFVEGNQKSIITNTTFIKLHNTLPTNQFVRIHRSYMINLKKALIIEKQSVMMSNGETVPVSDSCRLGLMEKVNKMSL